MTPYAATKKNAQNSYSCTNDGSRGRRDESHRDACACITGWCRALFESKPSWPGAARGGSGPVDVCARWCPTLPHPGGCSTIGAVRLSFRVRDGYRAFPCRCDHRDDYVGSASVCSYDSVIGPPVNAHCVLVVGLGVDRIVDASLYCGCSPPPGFNHWRVGVLLFVSAY